ncbi:MAG: MFS transporter [Desulfatitalea sp.]|nr:MFS transporter [Desulfatitalea sp.]
MIKGRNFRGWMSIAGATASIFALGAAMYSFGVFLPWLCKEFDWTRGQVSIGMSVLVMLASLLAPAAGFFVEKFGPRRAITGGNIVIVLAFVSLAYQQALWQFYFAYSAIGIGTAFAALVAGSTLATNWFTRKAPLAISILTAASGIGGLVLVPIIGLLIGRIGWRDTYLFLSAVIFAFGVLVPLVIVKNRPEDVGTSRERMDSATENTFSQNDRVAQAHPPDDVTLHAALRTREFWLLTALRSIAIFVFVFFTAHQAVYLTDQGLSMKIAAFTLGVLPGASVIGTLAVGFLALKTSLKWLGIVSTAAMFASTIIAPLIRSAPMAFVFSVLFGCGYGAVLVCNVSLIPLYFGKRHFSKILGVSIFLSIFGMLGAPVGGFLFDAQGTYFTALIIMSAITALGLICIISIRSHKALPLKLAQK